MAATSTYLANKLLNHALGTSSFTMPTTVYIALFKSDPTAANTGTEVSGTGYSRVACSFYSASGGNVTNSANAVFGPAVGSWGTVTHFGILDALTGGNLLFYGTLVASKVISDGDAAQFNVSDLSITMT